MPSPGELRPVEAVVEAPPLLKAAADRQPRQAPQRRPPPKAAPAAATPAAKPAPADKQADSPPEPGHIDVTV